MNFITLQSKEYIPSHSIVTHFFTFSLDSELPVTFSSRLKVDHACTQASLNECTVFLPAKQQLDVRIYVYIHRARRHAMDYAVCTQKVSLWSTIFHGAAVCSELWKEVHNVLATGERVTRKGKHDSITLWNSVYDLGGKVN